MFSSGVFAEELAVRVGCTLIHSFWQIALIGGLFWIINRALARRSANLRYVVGCVAMLLMLAVPLCWMLCRQNPVVDEATSLTRMSTGLVALEIAGINRFGIENESFLQRNLSQERWPWVVRRSW